MTFFDAISVEECIQGTVRKDSWKLLFVQLWEQNNYLFDWLKISYDVLFRGYIVQVKSNWDLDIALTVGSLKYNRVDSYL